MLCVVQEYTRDGDDKERNGTFNIILAHANGFVKELYEPFIASIFETSTNVKAVFAADVVSQGHSGRVNADKLGDRYSWTDSARDLLVMVDRLDIAKPIVFALSNPTSKSECTATQAYRWSDGRALFACGSPFDPVTLDGRSHVPRQGNNSYIFPGVGLGVIASGASRVTDEMFMAAAHALAEQVTEDDLRQGSLYPPLKNVRSVSAHIAAAVAAAAFRRGLARGAQPADLLGFVKSQMYEPCYATYVAG